MTKHLNIKNCWAKIKSEKGTDQFVDRFYKVLFTRFPDTRELFPKDITTQKRKLLTTLDNAINGIEYIDDIREEMLALGQHHKELGITSEMYDAFIITILDAADFASNSTLTTDECTAWENAFREISDIMLEAY